MDFPHYRAAIMTTKAPTPESLPAPAARKWVWRSTDASILAGYISVLAVVETLFSVGVYWYLVWRFNWPWMMFISMLAAPMLLLRSERSVAMGVKWLRVYVDKRKERITKVGTVVVLAGGALSGGALYYWLAEIWLQGYLGWNLFWRAAVIGAVAVAAAYSISVAFTTSRVIVDMGGFLLALVGTGLLSRLPIAVEINGL